MDNIIYLVPLMALIGLVVMAVKARWVNKQDAGDEKMAGLALHIREGALAFLAAEYRVLSIFVVIAGILLGFISFMVPHSHWFIVIAFVIGAVFSAVAGNIGMRIATAANVRTTQAARTSLKKALNVSFSGGTVMGLGVAGLAVFGLSVLFIILFGWLMGGEWTNTDDMTIVLEALAGFSLGAESIALFARVGGGIYTKAADVGADLVGKVEAGIPEDDPRNPATIADNVGDNVGDVAGMGADLFGSYVATVLAAMVLGNYVIKDMGGSIIDDGFGGISPILLPLVIAGLGIIFSILGTLVVKIKNENAKEAEVQSALNLGNWGSIVLTAIASYFVIDFILPDVIQMDFFGEGVKDIDSLRVFGAVLVGLTVGGTISFFTEYYTGLGKKPVLDIVQKSSTGHATNVIAGLATGMISTFAPILLFAGAIWGSYELAGFYGVAIAASAMMATTAMQLAIDAFGPIADNAGGIAEMSGLPKEVREKTDILDSVGNTTAAIGKGFAIASAALTALALFAAYVTFTGIDGINIFKADVLAALFIGGMIPVVFSALAMNSVGKAAMEMVKEVRRQFREIPGIMEGTGKPEYAKCVDISTKAAIREMMLPGALTIVTPVIIGFVMGMEPLGSYMAGVTVSGVLWAIFQNNAGGAWDNAKKSFEAGVMIDGEMTYKGSEAHKAAVTGDTVGDPFKDTSGPSMNILIKLTCLVGLVLAPLLAQYNAEAEVVSPETTEAAVRGNERSFKIDERTMNLTPQDIVVDGATNLESVSGFIHWEAAKVGGEHNGLVKILDGRLAIKDDRIVDGMIRMAMTSINVQDIEEKEKNLRLVNHLKSEDFFQVEKYPYAIFKVQESNGSLTDNSIVLKGIMNIKGISNVEKVTLDIHESKSGDGSFRLTGTFQIDRSKYNIRYRSATFFNDLGDKLINDDITLNLDMTVQSR